MISIYLVSARSVDTEQIEHYGICGQRLERILSMNKEEDRKHAIAGSLLLKMVLQERGKSLLDVQVSETGKPYAEGLFFSLSHSGGMVALATAGEDIGIDIEKIRPFPKCVVERKFSRNEQKLVNEAIDKDEMCMRIWTAKEAWLKMTGSGIDRSLQEIDTAGDDMVIDCGEPIPVYRYVKRIGEFVICTCTRSREDVNIIALKDNFTEH